MQRNKSIDAGKGFDWGRTSADYAKYRDIYPPEFYQRLLELGLCTSGQRVLDLGTGTGVLPRYLYNQGAQFTGIDIAENQIIQARRLAQEAGMEIAFYPVAAEDASFPDDSFDVVTACQCFFYFDAARLLPNLRRMLVPGGKLAILYMAWLPGEDPIARASEDLVLRYNPQWSGGGETRHPLAVPAAAKGLFQVEQSLVFDLQVPFTRESWNGRIKACRGIGASLSPTEVASFEREHLRLLAKLAPEQFEVAHYAAMLILKAEPKENLRQQA